VWFLAGSLEREPGGAGEGLGRAEEGLTARFELVGDRVARRTRLGGLGGGEISRPEFQIGHFLVNFGLLAPKRRRKMVHRQPSPCPRSGVFFS
jgi:hypothetical protein